MSASTPTISVPAPASPFLYLVSDRCMLISWFVAIGAGLMGVLSLLQSPTHPLTVAEAAADFLAVGYTFWSLYFGLVACWRLVRRGLARIAWGWTGVAFLYGLVVGWAFIVFAMMYAVFGGGLYHFLRRWWLLAHGQNPPFLKAW
jgi:hypothetical protein